MSEKDVTEAFSKSLRKARPYAIAFVVVLLAMFAGLAVVASTGTRERGDLIWVGLPAVLVMVPLGLAILRAHRCPSCQKFMGRDLGQFCPLCAARIQKD
jgi:hypothetical protein